MQFVQKRPGARITLDFGESSVSVKSKIKGKQSSFFIRYVDVPFHRREEKDRFQWQWTSTVGVLFGFFIIYVGIYIASNSVDADVSESDPVFFIAVGSLLIFYYIVRTGIFFWRRGHYWIFDDGYITLVLLADEQFSAIAEKLDERRKEHLRNKFFGKKSNQDEVDYKERLAWMVDRDIISQSEYDKELSELDAESHPRKVGF